MSKQETGSEEETKAQREEVLTVTTHYEVRRLIKKDEIEITEIYFPIPPNANNVRTYITLDLKDKSISYTVINDSWNGTGVSREGYAELSDEEVEMLKKKFMEVKTVQDFEKLEEILKKIEEKRDKEVENAIEKLISKIDELDFDDTELERVKQLLENKEELKDWISQYLMDYASES